MQGKEQEASAFSKIKALKRKPLSLQSETMVTTGTFSPNASLPLIIRPKNTQLDVVAWAQQQQDMIAKELLIHGAILLRDFLTPSAVDFERFVALVCTEPYRENGEHVPVDDVGNGNLYTPVFYAPGKKLLWHNENSFNASWPRNILFYCARKADQGGQTPIVDSRKVYQRLDQEIREAFARKQILYVRNYSEELGLSWQKVFRTTERAEVEQYCRREAIDFAWKAGDRLKTWQLRPAVLQHPQTGEWIWWNQATHWHLACLDEKTRASLQELYSEEDLPRTCMYGDGSAIADEVMAEIVQAYQDEEVSFDWQEGDILMLDNMLAAHARNPYIGQRKIYVSMGNMLSLKDFAG